jgi:hypothetical protein
MNHAKEYNYANYRSTRHVPAKNRLSTGLNKSARYKVSVTKCNIQTLSLLKSARYNNSRMLQKLTMEIFPLFSRQLHNLLNVTKFTIQQKAPLQQEKGQAKRV